MLETYPTAVSVPVITMDLARPLAITVEGNQNQGNRNGENNGQGNKNGNEACGRVYALGEETTVQDNNVVTGMFLINIHYAYVLFDSDINRSFALTTFSEYLNVIPTTLDTTYHVELVDEKSVTTDTNLRGCTLNLQNHPFKPIELRSFNGIIGMDWLSKYHVVIVCHEKLVCVPYRNEVLTIQGDRRGVRGKSRLSIISCIKTHKYTKKGCPVFLIQVTKKEIEEKQLGDLPIMKDFSKVFPKDLPGLPPARLVEFQVELVPGAAPVARTPYRLAPAEIKELSEQLKELANKGFIRPSSSPWRAPV
ncbi:putative reverse transcriptase domain-containing protein [Tanacetum coccineum]